MSELSDDTMVRKSCAGCTKCLRYRYVTTSMITLACATLYTLRVDLSIAIVAMVNQSALAAEMNNVSGQCDVIGGSQRTNTDGEFVWTKDVQGLILSSFFFGYIVLQIPGGWLASKISGKWTIGVGVLSAGLLSFSIPSAARTGVWLLVLVRALQGLALSLAFPATTGLCGRWFPASEVTWLSSITQAGSCCGIIFGLSVSALLCEYGFAGGWPSVFYVNGSLACLWFVSWVVFVYDSPDGHPHITDKERLFILASVGISDKDRRKLHTPWMAILKSPAVWGATAAIFAFDWNLFTMLTSLPQYMNDVIGFDLLENGTLSSLPYLVASVGLLLSSRVSDYIRTHGWLSTTLMRKIMVAISLFTMPAFFVGISYLGCNKPMVVVFLCFGMLFLGLGLAIERTNSIDLSPNHAGVIFGINNTFGSLSGIVAPYVVGLVTNHEPTHDRWIVVFYIASGISVCGGIVFLLIGSGERQSWNDTGMLDDADDDEKGLDGQANAGFQMEIPSGVNLKRRLTIAGPIL